MKPYFWFVIAILIFGLLYYYDYKLLTAISVIPVFIGIYEFRFGNMETRSRKASEKNRLDQDSLNFLTQFPEFVFEPERRETRIKAFREVVWASFYYSNDRRYLRYATLVERMAREDNQNTFMQIKNEAIKLRYCVDDGTYSALMQNLYNYEAKIFWDKNIYLIRNNDFTSAGNHPFVLIYDDATTGGTRPNDQEDRTVRQMIDANFLRRVGLNENDTFYHNEDESEVIILYPRTDYILMDRKDCCFKKWIKIRFRNGEIILYYRKPRSYSELGIRQ